MRISDWSSDVCSSDLQSDLCSLRPISLPRIFMANQLSVTRPPRPAAATTKAPQHEPASPDQRRDVCPHAGGSPSSFTRPIHRRSEEHTSELQSLMRISYAVFCLKKKKVIYKPVTYQNIAATINTITSQHFPSHQTNFLLYEIYNTLNTI